MKAWINMRSIAKLLGMSELKQAIHNLEKGRTEGKSSISETEKIAFNRISLVIETNRRIAETPAQKQKIVPIRSNHSETLDIVNYANVGFRRTVLSHNVYLCPAKGS